MVAAVSIAWNVLIIEDMFSREGDAFKWRLSWVNSNKFVFKIRTPSEYKNPRSAYKPHSVQRENPPGWTSILAGGHPSALAIYPEMVGKRAVPVQ